MSLIYCDRSRTTGLPHPEDHGFCPLLICTTCGESERYHWTDCVMYRLSEDNIPEVSLVCPVCKFIEKESENLEEELKNVS